MAGCIIGTSRCRGRKTASPESRSPRRPLRSLQEKNEHMRAIYPGAGKKDGEELVAILDLPPWQPCRLDKDAAASPFLTPSAKKVLLYGVFA